MTAPKDGRPKLRAESPFSDAELSPRVRDAFVTLMEDVNQLRNELEQAKRRLREMESLADRDALMSNVLNRRAFVRELTRTISLAERYDFGVSLIYFDLNNFKAINDRYGHTVGDTLLKSIGSILITGVRDTDFVGRLGGDEFAACLVKAGTEDALKKAERLARLIDDVRVDTGNGLKVRVSTCYGAYTFEKGVSVEDAIAAADKAMYESKARAKAESEAIAHLAMEAESVPAPETGLELQPDPEPEIEVAPEPEPEPAPAPKPAQVLFERPARQ